MQLEKLQMKNTLTVLCSLLTVLTFGQNINVDSQTYTPQQLIEDILIDSDCIDNVIVTNVVGGNFNGSDQSYGFFDATGTNFPFESGLVLSTGRLLNVPGPNTSLSDDDAPDWSGDNELEYVLNENNTLNATILEFDFTSIANEISFRYIFASEEYQEDNPNTCQYSDLFGFLIRPITEQEYTNIAVVPDTQTPVKVTTVHPEIPGGCAAENEAYFESFNSASSPINFNGQTKVLTAVARVTPNQTYHVKLVIADEQNFRYDSVVFLEAGSFRPSTDLGPDQLIANGTAICGNETFTIETNESGANNTYTWFKDGVELSGETNSTLDVNSTGFYEVEINKDSCLIYGEVRIEYVENPIVYDSILIECDQNQNGLTTYNLFDAESSITNNDNSLAILDFFLTENDAEQFSNAISGANAFQNTIPFQTIYAVVSNQANCTNIAAVELQIANNTINIPPYEICDTDSVDGIAEFNLNSVITSISNQIPINATVRFFETEEDTFSESNPLPNTFQNTIPFSQILFVKVESENQCYAVSTVELIVLPKPELLEDETIIYCLNSFPENITLIGGVINNTPNNYYYEWLVNGNPTEVTTTFNNINEPGIYTVIVTGTNGCSSSRTISVLASNDASIDDIIVIEGTSNNSVTVSVSGVGDYEYALDNEIGPYQSNNTFSGVSPGFHTVFVQDINGCGIVEKTISVLGFPKFFTPNGDTYNDYWQVYGVNSEFNQGTTIQIFNRYGKLITQFTNENVGWDGTLNGRALPANDYWFKVSLADGRTFTGHFSLKR